MMLDHLVYHGDENSGCQMSPCRRYRYRLWRRWGPCREPHDVMTFIMLNPSTADHTADDPTIRRCLGFARRQGCGALLVVNLYAMRATDPRNLWSADDPEGPANDHVLQESVRGTGWLVGAWGACRNASMSSLASTVVEMAGSRLMCLGVTKDGSPRHPLYVPGDALLMRYQ